MNSRKRKSGHEGSELSAFSYQVNCCPSESAGRGCR